MTTTVTALTIAVASRPEADRHGDRRRRPDAGGRGQAVHLAALGLLDHRPGTEEADAGHHALDHPAQVGSGQAGLLRNQHEQGGAERDQHVGAQAGGAFAARSRS
jgi:hypothetical protein